jgi:hypothetical protein
VSAIIQRPIRRKKRIPNRRMGLERGARSGRKIISIGEGDEATILSAFHVAPLDFLIEMPIASRCIMTESK